MPIIYTIYTCVFAPLKKIILYDKREDMHIIYTIRLCVYVCLNSNIVYQLHLHRKTKVGRQVIYNINFVTRMTSRGK